MTKEQLGTLILNSERQLYSTAKTILFDDQDCADAIQETIVKAFSKIETLRNDKYARTWLIRILINECYTLLRKSRKLVSLEGKGEMTEIEAEKKTDYSDLYRAVHTSEMTYYSVSENYGNGGNYISSLKPGESKQVNMAWIVNENELDHIYLNLNGEGGAYQFSDSTIKTGLVDICQ